MESLLRPPGSSDGMTSGLASVDPRHERFVSFDADSKHRSDGFEHPHVLGVGVRLQDVPGDDRCQGRRFVDLSDQDLQCRQGLPHFVLVGVDQAGRWLTGAGPTFEMLRERRLGGRSEVEDHSPMFQRQSGLVAEMPRRRIRRKRRDLAGGGEDLPSSGSWHLEFRSNQLDELGQ